MSSAFSLPPLYPIIDLKSDGDGELERVMDLAVELAGAGVALLQLRAKGPATGIFARTAARMVARLRPMGCALVVNDRADIAVAASAAGVHLGGDDLPVGAARSVVGPDAILGLSTHSRAEVTAASGSGADYLGFGPVFESPTKAGARTPRGLEQLGEACRASSLPIVAIGGVDIDRAPHAWQAGAAAVAVISELESAGDIAGLVAAYMRAVGG